MKLEAKQRLQAVPWEVLAMPQIDPTEYESSWFEDFGRLVKDSCLFSYNGHEVCGYREPGSDAIFFVALKDGQPVYINQVYQVRLDYSALTPLVQKQLHGHKFWLQSSVAFNKEADRTQLKGLATKIFWDYLASNRNAAITDSQQSPAGATFWKKILSSGVDYLPFVINRDYRVNRMSAVSSAPRFTDRAHLQYDINSYWQDSHEGRLLRILVTRSMK